MICIASLAAGSPNRADPEEPPLDPRVLNPKVLNPEVLNPKSPKP